MSSSTPSVASGSALSFSGSWIVLQIYYMRISH
jgi:hypothetical protein